MRDYESDMVARLLLCLVAFVESAASTAPSPPASPPPPPLEPGTVRIGTVAALRAALSHSNVERILLEPGTYPLHPGGELTIVNRVVNVTALEPGTATLDASGGTSRVLSINGSEVVLSGLDITGGTAAGDFFAKPVRSLGRLELLPTCPWMLLPIALRAERETLVW